jgi:hypothetical protein
MNKTKYSIVFIFVLLFILILKPINTSKENCVKIIGKVKSVVEGGRHDLVIELENNNTTYYINRGLENGFSIQKASKDFIGKNVIIYYAKSWTPLAQFGKDSEHICQLIIGDRIAYSEWK